VGSWRKRLGGFGTIEIRHGESLAWDLGLGILRKLCGQGGRVKLML
jgi:hypothetical protein